MRGLLATLVLALGVGFAAACGLPDEAADLLSDSSYIEVMARLARVRAESTPRDSVRTDSARRAVLAELGVDTSDLSGYAARYGEDAAHMMEIWTAINQRVLALDSLEREEEREGEPQARDSLSTSDARE